MSEAEHAPESQAGRRRLAMRRPPRAARVADPVLPHERFQAAAARAVATG